VKKYCSKFDASVPEVQVRHLWDSNSARIRRSRSSTRSSVADVEAFYHEMSAKGVLFSMPPKKQDFGGTGAVR
jgi:uncharacterized glyoxalase superfamily protein PhnB